jgi:hypothetical protein
MKLLMQPLQPFAGDMGINLRGREIRMAQHDLDTAQIGAVFQQMGGKGMTESVRRNVFNYS